MCVWSCLWFSLALLIFPACLHPFCLLGSIKNKQQQQSLSSQETTARILTVSCSSSLIGALCVNSEVSFSALNVVLWRWPCLSWALGREHTEGTVMLWDVTLQSDLGGESAHWDTWLISSLTSWFSILCLCNWFFILNDSCHIIHNPCYMIYFYIEVGHYFEFLPRNFDNAKD